MNRNTFMNVSISISEVGGSESAFRQAPPNREIVSFVCSCVRVRGGMLGGNGAQTSCCGFSLFPLAAGAFPFSLWGVRVLPFSLKHNVKQSVNK